MISLQESVSSWLCFYLYCVYFYTEVWWWSVQTKTCTLLMLTLLLTYSMEQSPSWEANRFFGQSNSPHFMEPLRFITAFTSACHLSLSWARSIQSMPPHPISWSSILILSSNLCLGLPSYLFPTGFPTKTLYTSLLSPIRATCPTHLILLALITQTVLDEE